MPDSPYAPPKTEILEPISTEPPFYVVTPGKFYLLSVLTMHLYLVYWFYRNWRNHSQHTRSDIWPVARGLFYIFFTHSLFNAADRQLRSMNEAYEWNPKGLATLFVLLWVFAAVVGSRDGIAALLVWTALVFATPLVLLPAQRALNLACGDPTGGSNSHLTAPNWAWMIVGGLLLLVAFAGIVVETFMPELLVE